MDEMTTLEKSGKRPRKNPISLEMRIFYVEYIQRVFMN